MNIRLMGRMCLRCRERDHLCKTFLTRVENERERGKKKEERKQGNGWCASEKWNKDCLVKNARIGL